ncbi:MAG: N-acetyltransferase [Methanomicrobiaceae archaeon]|nr:N-acetyltransferase [Methanomicrobiaceae archaeon]
MDPFVEIGDNPEIGEYVILGKDPAALEKKLEIGENCRIRSHSVIYRGNRIGSGFQTGHGVMIRENNIIGDNVSIGTHSIVEKENVIGDGVRIHSNCFIPEFVVIEEGAWIGPSVTILNTLHPPCPCFSECAKGVVIGKGARIGGNVTIGPHVRIGAGAVIGFGSVVTKSVPDNCVAYGNPAQIKKEKGELTCVSGLRKRPYDWEDNDE